MHQVPFVLRPRAGIPCSFWVRLLKLHSLSPSSSRTFQNIPSCSGSISHVSCHSSFQLSYLLFLFLLFCKLIVLPLYCSPSLLSLLLLFSYIYKLVVSCQKSPVTHSGLQASILVIISIQLVTHSELQLSIALQSLALSCSPLAHCCLACSHTRHL